MKITAIQKSLLATFLFSATLWFGGGLVRTAIGFDVFLPGTLDIKPFLTQEQINYSIDGCYGLLYDCWIYIEFT
jgi:hypothetical protein